MVQNRGWLSEPDPWSRRHRGLALTLRGLLTLWLLFLVAVLCAEGYWWALVILIPLALNLQLMWALIRTRSR